MNYSLVELVLQYRPEPPLAAVFAPANAALSEVVGSVRNARACVGKRGFRSIACGAFNLHLFLKSPEILKGRRLESMGGGEEGGAAAGGGQVE